MYCFHLCHRRGFWVYFVSTCVTDEDYRYVPFTSVSSVRITGTFVSTCVTGEDHRYVSFTPVSSVRITGTFRVHLCHR